LNSWNSIPLHVCSTEESRSGRETLDMISMLHIHIKLVIRVFLADQAVVGIDILHGPLFSVGQSTEMDIAA